MTAHIPTNRIDGEAPCVWIVIVNFRTPKLTAECLSSLSTQVGALRGGKVVVVDNDSGDGSVAYIAEAIRSAGWGGWVSLLPLPRNGGFAYGNNAGIGLAMAAGARAVMLLNPDTIVREGAIAAVSGFLDRNPEVGIAGSLIENPAGGVECSAHRVHTPLSELEGGARLGILSRLLHRQRVSEAPRSEAHSCDWVSGAAMLIRRGVIERIGLMDEGFFLYFEEVDFCWRARQSGWAVWYVPEARVLHLEGASTGIRSVSKRRAAYWYDSRRRYFIKHNGAAGLVLADLLWAAGRCTYLLRRVLGLGAQAPASDPQWLMFDLLWGDVRALMSGAAGRIPRWPK